MRRHRASRGQAQQQRQCARQAEALPWAPIARCRTVRPERGSAAVPAAVQRSERRVVSSEEHGRELRHVKVISLTMQGRSGDKNPSEASDLVAQPEAFELRLCPPHQARCLHA